MIYITGDTHGDFRRIKSFCRENGTKKSDVLIILGDAGINIRGGEEDRRKKEMLESLSITLFAIHGNHENRPYNIQTYKETMWCGGMVYYEEAYPHILFAQDGEIFDFDGKKSIVIGGAYSIDKDIRLRYGWNWWKDEQPSEAVRRYVESRLKQADWKIDVVLSHTVPVKYEPTECFLPGIDQSDVDKSTELWLDSIEDRLDYQKWYCGHYHTEKQVDKLEFMFENIEPFCV